MYMLQLTEDSTSNSAHFALKDALCFRCPVVKKWDETAPKLLGMKPTICVLLLGLLGMASCHGISNLTAQSVGPGTTADWPKGRRQGTLIERIIISANEIPTDRPSGGVVMFSGDSVQLDRMQRAQARRRGWTTSLSEGLRASVRFGRNLTKSSSFYALFSFYFIDRKAWHGGSGREWTNVRSDRIEA